MLSLEKTKSFVLDCAAGSIWSQIPYPLSTLWLFIHLKWVKDKNDSLICKSYVQEVDFCVNIGCSFEIIDPILLPTLMAIICLTVTLFSLQTWLGYICCIYTLFKHVQDITLESTQLLRELFLWFFQRHHLLLIIPFPGLANRHECYTLRMNSLWSRKQNHIHHHCAHLIIFSSH